MIKGAKKEEVDYTGIFLNGLTYTIEKLNQLIVNPMLDEKLTKEALNCEDLGLAFKNSLAKRYELGDKDEQFSYYHT